MSVANPAISPLRSPAVCNSYASDETLLEQQIEAAKQRMCAAPARDDKLAHWREMCRLMEQRTPHRVRFMERMRGLA